jgi:hypothetical protein
MSARCAHLRKGRRCKKGRLGGIVAHQKGEERVAERKQTGGGASPRPPHPDSSSREALERQEHQEWQGILELSVL